MENKQPCDLVQEYFKLLKGMGATIYTKNGCPVKAVKVLDGDATSVFIRENDRGDYFDSLVTGYLAIAPASPINSIYTVPKENDTARMRALSGFVDHHVTVFMPNGFQLTGTLKSYSHDAMIINTSAYGTHNRDVLLIETSTVRIANKK